MDRALRLHNATSPSAQSWICSQCCAEARTMEEYRPGVGRFSVRVCQKPACAWRDESFLLAEPAVPTGPGSCGLASTRAYLRERFAVVGTSLTLIGALDPICREIRFANWQRHHQNAYRLVEEGYLVQDGTGTMGAPTYRLAHSGAVTDRLADREGK